MQYTSEWVLLFLIIVFYYYHVVTLLTDNFIFYSIIFYFISSPVVFCIASGHAKSNLNIENSHTTFILSGLVNALIVYIYKKKKICIMH